MKYLGTITQVRGGKSGMTLVIETDMGLRGVEMDRELWRAIMTDFKLGQADDVVGWEVAYDPAHGDLEIVGPSAADDASTDAETDADGDEAET
ncbi:MAG: hypothetical protein K8S97_02160 [Anaerolineae bacterium]|nr:hypothetical protein [Anaerolineae bacterium]